MAESIERGSRGSAVRSHAAKFDCRQSDCRGVQPGALLDAVERVRGWSPRADEASGAHSAAPPSTPCTSGLARAQAAGVPWRTELIRQQIDSSSAHRHSVPRLLVLWSAPPAALPAVFRRRGVAAMFGGGTMHGRGSHAHRHAVPDSGGSAYGALAFATNPPRRVGLGSGMGGARRRATDERPCSRRTVEANSRHCRRGAARTGSCDFRSGPPRPKRSRGTRARAAAARRPLYLLAFPSS